MSWGPLRPARMGFSEASPSGPHDPPFSPGSGDLYPARAGALAQARHVFLGGNGLPGRWAGRHRFVVLETGFGLGHNFLATWQAWQQDPQRCDQLWYVAIENHPPLRADLARAHAPAGAALPALAAALIERWPALTPDLHLIDFEAGRLRLLLALGDVVQVLADLVARVDAFYLDGFAPARNPAMWDAHRLRCLPRLAADGATLATWSVASAVREGLRAAGFSVEKAPGLADQREMTVGRFAPRFQALAPPGRRALAGFAGPDPRPPPGATVAVIGAGLAGAAVARALAAQRVAVQVFDRQAGCARETSGNAGGLFHGIVHGHDGLHARWLRSAALHTQRLLQPLIDSGQVPGALAGLLRGEQALDAAAMRRLVQRLALPADFVQVRDAALPGGPAWFYPGGGWVAPAALCAAWLAAPGISSQFNTAVQRLQATPDGWRLWAADGRRLGDVAAVVLCNAADASRLLGQPGWPLRRWRGQTTELPLNTPGLPGLPMLALPVADTGYALRLSDGRLLCGGSAQQEDDETGLRSDEHAQHLAILRRLTGWAAAVDLATLQGRVGWRLQSDDRLPLLGPVPDAAAALAPPNHRRLDQPRFVPRQPGLYVFTALGSRGITQAALGGELLASWITGAPMAAPSSLLDGLDAARFIARAVRRPGGIA